MATDCLIPLFLAQASQAPSNGLDNGTWMGLVIATCATLYIFYRAKRKTKRDPLERHPVSSSMAQQRAVERQMSNLLIELSDMARTVSASIDTRTAKLEALLDEADKRIETLRALSGAQTQLPTSTPPQPVLTPRIASQDAPACDERHMRVYELSDLGQSVREIADALGRPTGEVELILALRSREPTAKAS